jgi:uncharacterized protein DUF2510
LVAIGALAVTIGAIVIAAWPLVLIVCLALAVQVYEDRRAQGLPHYAWPNAVVYTGPLAYIAYLRSRRETLANRTAGTPRSPEEWQAARAAVNPHPPAWHPDPLGEAKWRWWDGAGWTRHTA